MAADGQALLGARASADTMMTKVYTQEGLKVLWILKFNPSTAVDTLVYHMIMSRRFKVIN